MMRSFVKRGGLALVMQLLSHPELQYFAMSALVVLLSSPGSAVFEHPRLASNAVEEVHAATTTRRFKSEEVSSTNCYSCDVSAVTFRAYFQMDGPRSCV